jgi:transcription elongation factor GreA
MNRIPMTATGEKRLREELERRKNVDRRRITQAIAEAKAHGDLKENAEYHAAREEQSFNEGRIQEVEAKLSDAEIIDIHSLENTGRIVFGATVQLINVDTDAEVVYQIVGEDEADIKSAKISISSPIARALIGKVSGNEVDVVTPGGVCTYEVARVDYI